MDIEYTWIACHCQGKNFYQFRLLTWTSFVGQFYHPVGGEGMDYWWMGGSLFQPATSFIFFRVHLILFLYCIVITYIKYFLISQETYETVDETRAIHFI